MDSKMNKLQMSRLRKMFEDSSLAYELKQVSQGELRDDFDGYDEDAAENEYQKSVMKISDEGHEVQES